MDKTTPKLLTVGQRVTYWREQRKMTRRQLAARAKISYSGLSGIETDQRKNPRELIPIAVALRINPIYLKTGEGPPESTDKPGFDDLSQTIDLNLDRITDLTDIELDWLKSYISAGIDRIEASRGKKRAKAS